MKTKILMIAFIASMLFGYAQTIPFDYSVKLNYIDEMKNLSERILGHKS